MWPKETIIFPCTGKMPQDIFPRSMEIFSFQSHGHDRTLTVCKWTSVLTVHPVLQSTPWPDEDLSLTETDGNTPAPFGGPIINHRSGTSARGFWKIHTSRVLLDQGNRLLWRHVGCSFIGILSRETRLHYIGTGRIGRGETWSHILLSLTSGI